MSIMEMLEEIRNPRPGGAAGASAPRLLEPSFWRRPGDGRSSQEPRELLIIGASARAAAETARAQGWGVFALDLFGDRDLLIQASRCRRIHASAWPDGIADMARSFPAAPFLPAGGLENAANVVAALESERLNLGVSAAAIRRARDPFLVHEELRRHDFPAPELLRLGDLRDRSPPSPRRHEPWVLKPYRSGGGRRIRFLHDLDSEPHRLLDSAGIRDAGYYLQEWIPGPAYGACFQSFGQGDCRLFGISRQLIGEEALGAAAFQYCGSLGPSAIPPAARREVEAIGVLLSDRFDLRGPWGLDGIVHSHSGRFYPLEINPRYPASWELHELAERFGPAVLKAIVFADEAIEVRRMDRLLDRLRHPRLIRAADIPADGERFLQGQPILSLLIRGADSAHCLGAMEELAGRVRRSLKNPQIARRPLEMAPQAPAAPIDGKTKPGFQGDGESRVP